MSVHDEDREDRLLAAARKYQQAIDAGDEPNRWAYLRDHADLADELSPYLEAIDALRAVNAPTSPHVAKQEPIGVEQLGDFRIVGEIGRGGMGVVYEAVQLSLGRRVALKVLSFAGALDPRQLARFRNEAQAAAHLHHTNIVPVYSVGSERSVHFYAMQLIEGRSLAELIVDARRLETVKTVPAETVPQAFAETMRTTSGGKASVRVYRRVAQLMAQAASALDHAHGLGVVHRDIKPANLLLDATGHLWVADFGLAQFAEGDNLTRTGDMVGTLRYMSPEQAGGTGALLDRRTDIYSLGATFYELVALEPVFGGSSRAELLHQIVTQEPRPLRAIDRNAPPELETILMKCLAKVPGERYGSGQELADDLGRFLDNRPILAKRPGVIDRARKWARRHPGVFAAVGVVLLTATVGLAVSNALIAREQEKTRTALVGEQARATEAENRLLQTRQLVDLLVRIGEEELDDRPELLPLRRRLMETALTHYRKLIDEAPADDDSTAEMQAVGKRVEQILADLVTMRGAGTTHLLQMLPVQRDLALTDEQKDTLREADHDHDRRRRDVISDRELTHAQKQRRFLDLARSAETVIRRTLTAKQAERLQQISLRVKGVTAFREPEVISALALTSEQRSNLRQIERESGPPMMGGPKGKGRGFGGPKDDRPPRPDGMPKALAVLTPPQRETWEALVGEPFTMPPNMFRPFGLRP